MTITVGFDVKDTTSALCEQWNRYADTLFTGRLERVHMRGSMAHHPREAEHGLDIPQIDPAWLFVTRAFRWMLTMELCTAAPGIKKNARLITSLSTGTASFLMSSDMPNQARTLIMFGGHWIPAPMKLFVRVCSQTSMLWKPARASARATRSAVLPLCCSFSNDIQVREPSDILKFGTAVGSRSELSRSYCNIISCYPP